MNKPGILVDVLDTADRFELEKYTPRQMNAWCKLNLSRMVFDSPVVADSAVHLQDLGMRGAGVYFLVRGRLVTYVGQSGNVPTRIYQHACAGRDFDGASVIAGVPPWLLDCVEYAYINAWHPPENGKRLHGNGCRGSDGFDAMIAATDASRVAPLVLQVVPAADYRFSPQADQGLGN